MNDRMLSDEILLGLIKANSGGGGGGTTDYDDLSNKPQIAGTTLSGNKSLADLGIASASDVETALDRKQDVLLYGGANPSTGADGDMYVKLVRDESTLIDMFGSPSAESTDDYEMSYAVDSSVMGDYYDYEAFGTGKGFGQNGRGSMTITYHFKNSKFKPVNVSYCNNFSLSGGGYLESANFTIKASNDGTNWDTLYSTSSSCPRDTSVSADITANTYYSYFKFEMNSGGGYTGIRNIVMNGISESYSNIDNIYFKNDGTWLKDSFAHKSEIDAIKDGTSIDSFADVETALTGKQDTLTFDDTPTDNSNNPVKSNGIYDALALKQNATDNNLETEAKTIVGAINENANDISSLESGFTNLDNEVNGDATTYPYADVITIEDAVPSNLADCNVKIEPVQDLHGYDKPWVGGTGKNKVWCTRDVGTKSHLGGNIITNADGTIELDGTFSENFTLIYNDSLTLPSGSYKLNGGITECSMTITNVGSTYNTDEYSFTLNSDYSGSLTMYITARQYNHAIIKPMIRLSTETDATFAPYTNICPISGHTEASVTDEGKNILDLTTYTSNKYLNASGVETDGTGYGISDYLNVGKSLQYSASGLGSVNGTYACFYDDSKAFISSSAESNDPFTFTAPSNARYVRVTLRNVSALTAPQVEMGATATPYEPYQGKTYTIALGDTIYGGTVDFDSGVMTVDRKGVDMGTLTWTYHAASGEYTEFFDTNLPNDSIVGDAQITANIISPLYKTIPSHYIAQDGYDNGVQALARETRRLITCDKRYSNTADYTNAVDGNILVYELATPTTIQLTPQQIQLLKGQNTLTASTGQISVTVNGVSGAIGAVQEQVNDHEERIETLESGGGSSDDYTNTEQVVGTWMGEPLYRKSYYNASYSSGDVDFNISNIKAVIKIEGMAQIRFVENDYDSFIPIPYINGNVNAENKFQQGPATQTGKITMSIGNNYTALLPVKLYMTMYYTKSTT